MQDREILFRHVAHIAPVTHMRSTLLQMSVTGLRERGHFDRWAELLAPAVRTRILESVGPEWVDIDVAFAHYVACDSLRLPKLEIETLGGMAGARMRTTFIGTILSMINQVGVTPFAPIPHVGRAWSRGFRGGSLQVTKVGPKDCEFEVRGLSLGQIPYFRDAYMGLIRSATELFGARKAYVRVTLLRSDKFIMAVAWV